jgi:hypothetical protein
VPIGIPIDANPRAQNIDRSIYKDIAEHLRNRIGAPNTFHLKNKGVTLIADKVVARDRDDQWYDVIFSEGQGIIDGAHTYAIIQRVLGERGQSSNAEEPLNQFVKVEVLTGIDEALITEIAGGLNTAIQVQAMSLANLADEFDWIKEELKSQPYFQDIAFVQNEDKQYDVRDILVLLELFNIFKYPNEGTAYPIKAYTSKEVILSAYLGTGKGEEKDRRVNREQLERLRPILKDMLQLHDIISSKAKDRYNAGGGRKGGRLKFVEEAKKRPHKFPFIGKEGQYRLYRGALFPMLSAFRWMVAENKNGKIGWRGGFPKVLEVWEKIGQELMDATQSTSEELGRNPNAIGKSQNHWGRLHGIVYMRGVVAKR